MKNYVANAIGENLVAEDLLVETGPRCVPVGDDGVHVLYGDRETGVTVVVRARDEDDAERRILATFATAYVDCVDEAIDQTPIRDMVAAFSPEALA